MDNIKEIWGKCIWKSVKIRRNGYKNIYNTIAKYKKVFSLKYLKMRSLVMVIPVFFFWFSKKYIPDFPFYHILTP